MRFHKYQGAGNDFLIADNRDGSIVLSAEQIAALCDRRYGVGADGLMLLERSEAYDFRMTYFNSDGSGGMMCGNGGRCIVAFAADLGITRFEFDAADGYHAAEILEVKDGVKTVRMKMKDVCEISRHDVLDGVSGLAEGFFLDTGTRHYVRFVNNLEQYDIVGEGRDIRMNASEFLPVGVNVNFVESADGFIKVRTYEKGVEDETFACGTGIVASCIASFENGVAPSSRDESTGRVHYDVKAKKDSLAVDFLPADVASDVWLTGPAAYVAEIIVNI